MPELNINVNWSVRVKLTNVGRSHIAHQEYQPPEDPQGWTRWQLWELMETFGGMMCLGAFVPFETQIIVEIPVENHALELRW